MKTTRIFVAILICVLLITACAPKSPSGKLLLAYYNHYALLPLNGYGTGDIALKQTPEGAPEQKESFASPDGNETIYSDISYSDAQQAFFLTLNIYKGSGNKIIITQIPDDVSGRMDAFVDVEWTGYGEYLVIEGTDPSDSAISGAYIYKLSNGNIKPAGHITFPVGSTLSFFNYRLIGISPDGSKILSVQETLNKDVLYINSIKGTSEMVADSAISGTNVEALAWGSYGMAILSTSFDDNTLDGKVCLDIYHPNTHKSEKSICLDSTTDLTLSHESISLSPDGTKVAFVLNNIKSDTSTLIIKDLIGIGSEKVIDTGLKYIETDQVVWSPNGEYLAFGGDPDFSSETCVRNFYIVNTKEASKPQLIYTGDFSSLVTFCPNVYLAGWIK